MLRKAFGLLWSVNETRFSDTSYGPLNYIIHLQVDEDLLRKQQAAYSIAGIDEEVSPCTLNHICQFTQ